MAPAEPMAPAAVDVNQPMKSPPITSAIRKKMGKIPFKAISFSLRGIISVSGGGIK